jgi:hypothetical protein
LHFVREKNFKLGTKKISISKRNVNLLSFSSQRVIVSSPSSPQAVDSSLSSLLSFFFAQMMLSGQLGVVVLLLAGQLQGLKLN